MIKRHPEWGAQLLRELGGFSPLASRLVLDHHERLDGSGYPRGLRGGRARPRDARARRLRRLRRPDLDARLPRCLEPRATRSRCCDREAGTAFDPRCVEALERVLAREDAAAEPRRPTVRAQRPVVAHR